MTQPQTFVSAADENLIRYIGEARTRIVFIAPGLTKEVADALGNKIVTSNDGKLSVTVIIDGDPEVCRLGLGTIEGLQTISEHATENCVEC